MPGFRETENINVIVRYNFFEDESFVVYGINGEHGKFHKVFSEWLGVFGLGLKVVCSHVLYVAMM